MGSPAAVTDPYASIATQDPYASIATQAPAAQPAPQPTQPAAPQATRLLDRINAAFTAHTNPGVAATLQGFADPFIGVAKGGMNTVAGLLELGNGDAEVNRRRAAATAWNQAHPDKPWTDALAAAGLQPGGEGILHAGQSDHIAGDPADPELKRQLDQARDHDHIRTAAKWLRDRAHPEGMFQHIGELGEGLVELLGTDGLGELAEGAKGAEAVGKVPTMAERLRESQQVAAFLEKHPKMAGLVSVGLHAAHAAAKTGAQAGVQTFVKTGGDEGETGKAAAIGAAGGAILEPLIAGGSAAVKGTLERLARPSTTVDAVEDAAQGMVGEGADATNASRTDPGNALPPSTGKFRFRIQGTAPTEETLGRGDTSGSNRVDGFTKREVETAPARPGSSPEEIDAGIRQENARSEAGSMAATVPDRLMPRNDVVQELGTDARSASMVMGRRTATVSDPITTHVPPAEGSSGYVVRGGGGELITEDPNVASAHLASLETALRESGLSAGDEAALTAQRDDLREQMTDYYRHKRVTDPYKPNFPPVDKEMAMRSTPNLQAAGAAFRSWGADVYEQANRVSGGQWQTLNQHMNELSEKLAATPDVPSKLSERLSLGKQINEAQTRMNSILDDPRSGFDQTDIDRAKRNFANGYLLDRAHQVLKPLYGVEDQAHGGTGLFRGVNGNLLAKKWQEFLDAPQNRGARELFGKDRIDTIKGLLKANDTQERRRAFTRAIMDIAAYVGGPIVGGHLGGVGGGFAGEATAIGVRHVMHRLVIEPRIAKNLLFALESGANVKNYGPMIGNMIRATPAALATETHQEPNGQEAQQ